LGDSWHNSKAVVDDLILTLDDRNSTVRAEGACSLGKIGEPARSALPRTGRLLKDADRNVRTEAALALWRIDRRPESIDTLIDSLDTTVTDSEAKDAKDLRSVLDSVQPNGHKTPKALIAIGEYFEPATGTRIKAANYLRLIGKPAGRAIPKLNQCLTDKSLTLEVMAARAIWGISSQSAPLVPVLVRVLKDDYCDLLDLRLPASKLLGDIGPGAKESLPLPKLQASCADPTLRAAARKAIRKIEGSSD
jgi:HEAT repeat protein